MAILAEQVYKLIREQLWNEGITAYSDIAPDETTYPFVIYSIPTLTLLPDWSFNVDYENLGVKFNVYNNSDNPNDIVTILKQIEAIFDRTHLSFVDSGDGYLMCSKLVNNSIQYLDEDTYWLGVQDYEFWCQRDQGQDFESSSSTDSSSSSSSSD